MSAFAPILGFLTILATRIGFVSLDAYQLLYWLVLAFTVMSFFVALMGLRSLWQRGTKGGRRVSWALFFCLVTLVPFGWNAMRTISVPQQADTSTDLIVPPLFSEEVRSTGGDASAIIASNLKDGYPDLNGQRFRADVETVLVELVEIANERGLRQSQQRGRVGANDEIFVEFEWGSRIVRWPHETVVRLIDEGDTTFVDIRSRAIDLQHDLGTNAQLIEELQTRLDQALIRPAGV